MSHIFSLKTGSLISALGVGAVLALVAPIRDADAEPKVVNCASLKQEGGKFVYPEVKAFCDTVKGKEVAIKKAMKTAQKAYKDAGKSKIEKCESCHKTANGGELNGDAAGLWGEYKPFFVAATKAP